MKYLTLIDICNTMGTSFIFVEDFETNKNSYVDIWKTTWDAEHDLKTFRVRDGGFNYYCRNSKDMKKRIILIH